MHNYFLALLFFVGSSFFAQEEQDPKAKSILDGVSKVTKGYKSILAEYQLSILNKDNKQVDKQSGKITLLGDHFKLEIPGNIIICDGKTIWTHNKDAQELTIKNYEPATDDGINPTNIFTMYEKGYKYKYDKDEKIKGVDIAVINLYPAVKPEKKKYHTIKLYVDKTKKQVKMVKIMMKDGGVQIYELKSLSPNTQIPETTFIMDTKKFKPEQIIDERV